jgi:hypothetical protein
MCKGQVGTRRILNNLLDNWQTKCGFQEAPIRSERLRLDGDKKFADMMVPEAFDVAHDGIEAGQRWRGSHRRWVKNARPCCEPGLQ